MGSKVFRYNLIKELIGAFRMLESKVFNGGREYEKIINDFIIKLATEKKKVDFSKLWLISTDGKDSNSNDISTFSGMVWMGMNWGGCYKLVYKG